MRRRLGQRSMKCIDFIAKQRVMPVSSFIGSDVRRRDGEGPGYGTAVPFIITERRKSSLARRFWPVIWAEVAVEGLMEMRWHGKRASAYWCSVVSAGFHRLESTGWSKADYNKGHQRSSGGRKKERKATLESSGALVPRTRPSNSVFDAVFFFAFSFRPLLIEIDTATTVGRRSTFSCRSKVWLGANL